MKTFLSLKEYIEKHEKKVRVTKKEIEQLSLWYQKQNLPSRDELITQAKITKLIKQYLKLPEGQQTVHETLKKISKQKRTRRVSKKRSL